MFIPVNDAYGASEISKTKGYIVVKFRNKNGAVLGMEGILSRGERG
jgi:hypothetical protein